MGRTVGAVRPFWFHGSEVVLTVLMAASMGHFWCVTTPGKRCWNKKCGLEER
ncbi:hypothetical protein Ami103574_06805 [Aminipila butyrica]|uniref:Uncharacterized protein n=1 Tax=Aminipila butyrica TaxID=433296 RepID=A0A858BWE5_9FIRM|nr:hypothetical protein [Aminipila butyrica]QIB69054.1 hypothetical protein Ami103574_06805 [Aminipila butyrica]